MGPLFWPQLSTSGLLDVQAGFQKGIGASLLKPHTCYWPAIREAMAAKIGLDGLAHITGGGLYDNVPRILPEGIGVHFDKVKALPVPPIFKLLTEKGEVGHQEAYRVFTLTAHKTS